jgi:hypothetical protein
VSLSERGQRCSGKVLDVLAQFQHSERAILLVGTSRRVPDALSAEGSYPVPPKHLGLPLDPKVCMLEMAF